MSSGRKWPVIRGAGKRCARGLAAAFALGVASMIVRDAIKRASAARSDREAQGHPVTPADDENPPTATWGAPGAPPGV